MPAIITTAAGQAVRLTGRSVASLRIQLGTDRNFGRFIITSTMIRLRGAHQFLHAFNDTIYAHSYGNRIGDIRVSGVAFFALCTPGQQQQNEQGTGLDDVVAFYEANRLGNKNEAVAVQIGAWFYRCMLTECVVEANAGNQAGIGGFTFQFSVLKYGRNAG